MTTHRLSRAIALGVMLALAMPGGALAAAPDAQDDSATVAEDDQATTIDVLSNDDGDMLAIVAVTGSDHGTVAITDGASSVTYEPDADYNGSDSFEYTVSDGTDEDTATVEVTVDPVNDTPDANDDTKTVTEDTTTTIDALGNDGDPDGDDLEIVGKTNGSKGSVTITHAGADVQYDPNLNATGSDSFTYTISDGEDEDTATVHVTITAVDDPPVAVDDEADVAEDVTTPIDVLDNDTDIDGGLMHVVARSNGTHGTVTITGGGTGLSYDPAVNYTGSDSFTYGLNGGSTATVTVTVGAVDDPPVAVDDAASVTEDVTTPIDVLDNDSDIDGGTKLVESKTNGTHGAVTITGGGTGVSYDPDLNYAGADSFKYHVNGGSEATVSITVTGVDDLPAAVDDDADVAEDVTTPIDVLGNDTDIDGGPKQVASRTNGAHGDVTISGGGTGVSYAPNLNYVGVDSFTYKLNGGSQATVTVTVGAADDPPVAQPDTFTILEDATIQSFDVLDNDTDIDFGPMSVASVTDPPKGTASLAPNGSGVRYIPTANANGQDEFDYTLNGGSIATVTVHVTPVDDPPVAVGDTFTIAEDPLSPAPLDVRLNDTDIDGGPKTIVGATDGAKGTVAIVGSGTSVTYMPASNATGADTFTYTLFGGSVASVSISITPSNDLPVAGADSLSIPAGAAAVPVPVLANDTDVDGDALTIASNSAPGKGAVQIGAGGTSLTYKPFPGLFGADSFTYTVTDGNGGTAVGTVSVVITSGNHAPSAVNDAKSVPQGAGPTTLTILANDQDLDGNTLTITAKTNGDHGTVVITGGGTGLTYNPVNSYDGIDTFTYTISDGLASDSATVLVTVVHDNAPPVVVAPLARVSGQTVGAATTKTRLTWGATDPGSGIKRYKVQVSIDGKAWKTLRLPKTTSRTLAPALRTGHTYRFRVRATDGEGNTSAYMKGPVLTPVRSSEASVKVAYVGAWAKTKTTKALGGATRHATSSAKRARFTFTAYDVGWIATRTTKSGKARVYIDGALVTTIDLDRAKTTYRKLVFARHFATLGPHVLEIQPVGDGRVDIDGFVVLR